MSHILFIRQRQWYRTTTLGPGDLVFCRQTEIGFLRLVTQVAVMSRCGALPLSNSEAIRFLATVHGDPAVSRMDEPPATRSLWLKLAASSQSAPNTWMDAYLAAFAIALGGEMVTFDRGFLSYQPSGLSLLLLDPP